MITAPRSSPRFKIWPGLVFVLIGINFCVVGVTVYAANFRHASFSVEPDYDGRALHWDDTARQARHNADLGWVIRVDSTDRGNLAVSLIDKQGQPLDAASIHVEAFHHAHARNKTTVTLAAAESGQYGGPAAINIPGLWEFRFTVRRGPETFTHSLTRLIPPIQEGRS